MQGSFSRGFTRKNADLRSFAFICGLVFVGAFASLVNGATLPPGFTETSVNGLSNPTAMEGRSNKVRVRMR